ncbi:hypothetical protein [Methanobrevibacter sp. DSM 116169]|uniref:hypothetical protein n=1 Tax=Methanobrevibacter sp. DSM 116169 TaxID=3242727 RepID=UPI0038FCF1C6
MILKNEKGFLHIIDAFFAITLVFLVFLVLTYTNTISSPDFSSQSYNIKDSQDIMEVLSTKTNYNDKTLLENAEYILRENNNSKISINKVSILLNETLYDLSKDSNFYFTERNYLKEEVILEKGNINNANNLSVAIRYVGDYCFVLYLW